MIPSNHTSSSHAAQNPAWKVLAEFSLPRQSDSDNLAQEQVIAAVSGLNLSRANLERLKIALGKAILNVIEHGNPYRPELSVFIRVLVLEQASPTRETNQGLGTTLDLQTPNPMTKGSRQRLGKAWGFFLIHKMNDEGHVKGQEAHHTLELFLYREGDLR